MIKAILIIDGKRRKALYFNFELARSTDKNGRPFGKAVFRDL